MSDRAHKTKQELSEILRAGGLVLAEPFDQSKRYPPDREIFTECCVCHAKAHYTLEFIQDRERARETVCRACHWNKQYDALMRQVKAAVYDKCDAYVTRKTEEASKRQDEDELKRLLSLRVEEAIPEVLNEAIAAGDENQVMLFELVLNENAEADVDASRAIAENYGYELVDLVNEDKSWKLLYVVRCRSCGKQSVLRIEEVQKGCSCRWNAGAGDAADGTRGNGGEPAGE